MKIRDKFLISLPLYIALFVLVSVFMALSHLIDFNTSYLKEEGYELKIFYKQMEWALRPHLEDNNFSKVSEYCADFSENPDFLMKISDEKGRVLCDSRLGKNFSEEQVKRKRVFLPTVKTMNSSGEIEVGGKKYYLELTILEQSVLKTLIEAQKNIVIFFVMCFIFLLLCTIYVVLKVQIPFNSLQKSVTKIAKGDLQEEIEVPESRVLRELAGAVSIMSQKLKRQILRLRKLEEYRKDFIANISHEIKTPLTAISSAVELLECNKGSFAPQDLQCLDILGFQAKRLNALVNDILCLADIENRLNREDEEFLTFNLNGLVEGLIAYLNVSEPEINIKSEAPIDYLGNSQLIEQAVTNLIMNAVKYSKSSKIDVVLSATDESVRIEVKDYGVGIAPEHLERIFERFYRVDKARSRETGGTGLGLAIVKNIAILHGGDVQVQSSLGAGTTFSIVLPKVRLKGCSPVAEKGVSKLGRELIS